MAKELNAGMSTGTTAAQLLFLYILRSLCIVCDIVKKYFINR
jgi:hypothetical protein